MIDLGSALIAIASIGVVYAIARAWSLRQAALVRLADDARESAGVLQDGVDRDASWLRRWLALAGLNDPNAPALFVVACVAAVAAGVAVMLGSRGTVVDSMARTVSDLPGGIGDTLVAILEMGPWTLLLIVALAPTLWVRARRRQRVSEIERDLPLVLELFATLAEAGLGFDAALARIVESQPGKRPLASELATFQRDVLGGVPRLQALRNLASRIDVTSATIFVSAVIQAEQIGASIAETLRHQADDLRSRRREQALLMAQALPVKLVLPLISCFLPGIFVSTLGPVLFQMIQVADAVLRPVGR